MQGMVNPSSSSAVQDEQSAYESAVMATGTVIPQTVGQLFIAMLERDKAIVKELKVYVNEQKKEIIGHLDLVKAGLMNEILSKVTPRSGGGCRGKSSRSRASEDGEEEEERNVAHLDQFTSHDFVPYLSQCGIVVTIGCFATYAPQLRNWLAPETLDKLDSIRELLRWESMEQHQHTYSHNSGLGFFFFSAPPKQTYARLHGKIGRLWSFVLQQCVVQQIVVVRRTMFDKLTTPPEQRSKIPQPAWLAGVGKRKSGIEKIVQEVFHDVETTIEMKRAAGDLSTGAVSRVNKRRKTNKKKTPAEDIAEDRRYAVRIMRRDMARLMTYGRLDARKNLLSDLLFMVEKIKAEGGVESARVNGFEIIFGAEASAMEGKIPVPVLGTIWHIPEAQTGGASTERMHDDNTKSLDQLRVDFPSLSLRLKYKRIMTKPSLPRGDLSGIPDYWDEVDVVSLHTVALTAMAGSVKANDSDAFLTYSPNSLRAVHIVAIGLRALVKASLDLQLTEMEKYAMGNVSILPVPKGRWEIVTTCSESAEGDSIRTQKFSMTVPEYREAAAKRAATSALTQSIAATERSEGSQSAESPEDEDDDRYGWAF